MKKRKQNNTKARIEKFSKALLRLETIAVVNIDPSGHQMLCDIKRERLVQSSPHVHSVIVGMRHEWTIYISAFCNGYYKSKEIAISGEYRFNDLEEVIKAYYEELLNSCNPKHIIGSGWIANPCGISLSEEKAAKLFELARARSAVEDEKVKKSS